MKVFVVGGGGREHTLVWKIGQSPLVDSIYCAPGNGGIAGAARCVPIKDDDIASLVGFAKEEGIDLTVVGPELPLTLGIVDAFLIGCKMPDNTYRFAKSMDNPSADAIFISCTNYRTFDFIERLEQDCRKPVITSNQATFWAALRTIGCQEAIAGFGRLLQEF